MDMFLEMTAIQAAALHLGLLALVMLGLKIYVAVQRYKLKVLSGDVSNTEFGRATRVQLNAVEDVPVLMAGILGLALLGMASWYIHMAGGVLVIARIAHAIGLAAGAGPSIGRSIGTFGTLVVFLAVAGALIVHAFG
jgi:uncharacterized membrane protein YecN with MAPEG domain